ncbi:MAG: endonuclease V [Candidatus Verstraetearchaeota archaeon]|nr:endonuclease V [Candidatus Verstraetearchaeota archaeon]
MEAQLSLAKRVSSTPPDKVTSVCGMDVSYMGDRGSGAAVVMTYPNLEVVEVRGVEGTVRVPYMPTLLAFREMPLLAALRAKLRTSPSVYILNGHGVFHPRRLGSAAHFGVVFDVPTIGVASTPLWFEGVQMTGCRFTVGGRDVAAVVPSHLGGKVYVSAGHKMTLNLAEEIVRGCIRGHRLPEPLFLADSYSRRALGGSL